MNGAEPTWAVEEHLVQVLARGRRIVRRRRRLAAGGVASVVVLLIGLGLHASLPAGHTVPVASPGHRSSDFPADPGPAPAAAGGATDLELVFPDGFVVDNALFSEMFSSGDFTLLRQRLAPFGISLVVLDDGRAAGPAFVEIDASASFDENGRLLVSDALRGATITVRLGP